MGMDFNFGEGGPIGGTADSIRGSARSTLESIRNAGTSTIESARNFVKQNPWILLGPAGFGFKQISDLLGGRLGMGGGGGGGGALGPMPSTGVRPTALAPLSGSPRERALQYLEGAVPYPGRPSRVLPPSDTGGQVPPDLGRFIQALLQRIGGMPSAPANATPPPAGAPSSYPQPTAAGTVKPTVTLADLIKTFPVARAKSRMRGM